MLVLEQGICFPTQAPPTDKSTLVLRYESRKDPCKSVIEKSRDDLSNKMTPMKALSLGESF